MRKLLASTVFVSAVALLTGCAGPSPETRTLQHETAAVENPVKEAVGGARGATAPVTRLEAAGSERYEIVDVEADPMPTVSVGPFTEAMPLGPAMEIIAAQTGITVDIEADVRDRMVTLVSAEPLPADKAIDMLARSAGVFHSYKGGVLRIVPEKISMVTLPSLDEGVDAFVAAAEALGITVLSRDDATSTLMISAGPGEVEKFDRLMKRAWDGNNLIVFDTWIYEVALDDGSELGIDWQAVDIENFMSDGLAASFDSGSAAAAFTLGLVGRADDDSGDDDSTGSNTSGDQPVDSVILNFLKTQGSVKALSKPTLAMMSGKQASFRVGDKINYVKEKLSTTTTTEYNQEDEDSVITDSVDTGTTLDVTGYYKSGLVFADMSLEVVNLLAFDEFKSGDTIVNLPQINERKVDSFVQARPGDVIVIGGIMNEKSDVHDTMLPIGDITTMQKKSKTRSEIVIMMRPRVFEFRSR